jgi:hypothetical protein
MSRRSLDLILSISAIVVAVVLAIAGFLLAWGGSYANNTVTEQLTQQNISFGAAAELPDSLKSYADQAVTNGDQAKAYSELIGEHLKGVADGQTYSEISGQWIASNEDPAQRDPVLGAQRMTLFMGETLRGLLLNAYAFSVFGQIATIASWVSFIAAVLLFVLGVLGIVHARRTPPEVAVFEPEAPVTV